MAESLESQTLVIVPTYNEATNVATLGTALFQAVPDVDVLFVDDNSPDGTQDTIVLLQQQYRDKVYLLRRGCRLGLGTAYVAGFKWALTRHYQVIVQMDADLSHDPMYLQNFLTLVAQYDAVLGSRYVAGGGTNNWGLVRQGLSKTGALYSRWLLGLPIQDPTGGYNVWQRRVLEAIDFDAMQSEGYAFQIELKYRAYHAGFHLVERPIVFIDRRVGASKMSASIVLEAVLRTWRLRYFRSRPAASSTRTAAYSGREPLA